MLAHLGPTYFPSYCSQLVTVRMEPFPVLLGRSLFPIQLLGWRCSSRLPILKAHLHLVFIVNEYLTSLE